MSDGDVANLEATSLIWFYTESSSVAYNRRLTNPCCRLDNFPITLSELTEIYHISLSCPVTYAGI